MSFVLACPSSPSHLVGPGVVCTRLGPLECQHEVFFVKLEEPTSTGDKTLVTPREEEGLLRGGSWKVA